MADRSIFDFWKYIVSVRLQELKIIMAKESGEKRGRNKRRFCKLDKEETVRTLWALELYIH